MVEETRMSLRSKDERNLEKKRLQQLGEMEALQQSAIVDVQDEYFMDKITKNEGTHRDISDWMEWTSSLIKQTLPRMQRHTLNLSSLKRHAKTPRFRRIVGSR
jgi:hypothetical protein